MRMVSHDKFPPGGWRYYVPQTNWSITPWVSFDVAVREIEAHRRANPHLANLHGWNLDPVIIALELDAWNAKICKDMGWLAFITEGGADLAVPKAPSPQSGSSPRSHLAAGIRTLIDWEIASGKVVSQELAEERARNCSTCVKNGPGDLSSWFTEPAARLIRLQLETKNRMKLSTASDELLGVCEACSCPLKLKLWCPLDIILGKMPAEHKAALASNCWILSEKA